MDKDPSSVRLIQENLESLGLSWRDPRGSARVMTCDVSKAFQLLSGGNEKFDILLADPPYEHGVLKRIQGFLMEYPLLKPDGILAVEHGAKDVEVAADFPMALVRRKKYGDTCLSLFKNP